MAVSTNPPPRGSCGLTPTHPIAPKVGGSPHRPPHSASPWPHSGVQPHWGAQGEHPHGDTAVPECHQAGAPVTHREGTASHGWHRGRDGTPSSPRPVPNPVVPLPTPPPPPLYFSFPPALGAAGAQRRAAAGGARRAGLRRRGPFKSLVKEPSLRAARQEGGGRREKIHRCGGLGLT